MGRWLGDSDDYPDNDEQYDNLRRAEQERQSRENEHRHNVEQAQIESANAARRTANETFQLETLLVSSVLKMLEKERFVRWYQDKFVPLYIEDRQVSEEEILDDLKKLIK